MFRYSIAVMLVVFAGCDGNGEDCKTGFTTDITGRPVCNDNADSEPDPTTDTDKDGITDVDEAELGTDPENADSDGDTLLDGDEVAGGTDPMNADTDGDTLSDGNEIVAGTDPLSVDTDGDGYQDGWEITETTDPLDADSVIYQGGWPYNPGKDQYSSRTWADSGNDVGDALAFATFLDANGDQVDIYDFADQGKPIMIDISAMWCGPCQSIASWLSGGEDGGWDNYAPMVKDAVGNGDVYWITILGDDFDFTYDVDLEELQKWAGAFDDPNIPVFADSHEGSGETGDAVHRLLDGAWPTTILLDEHLEVTVAPGNPGDDSFYDPIIELEGMLEDGSL